ncbi:MAG: hypothetical protein HY747_02315 [Elusimicrobia bacterium]|nr:hypothetical protein [Elusimicrobiota bacterium]
MPNYGVIIIGTGPAGMFCARELAGEAEILMLDAGRKLKHKTCALNIEGKCVGCKPVCCILGGMGGAQFFLGTKLSRYPAGKGLLRFVTSVSELERIYDYTDQVLEQYGKLPRENPRQESIARLGRRCSKIGLEMKYYNAQKVSALEMNRIAERFFEELTAKKVERRFQERVIGVRQRHNCYEVRTDKGTYLGGMVVFATGRLGATKFSHLTTGLGLEWDGVDESEIEIGVRIETPYQVFDPVDNLHNDLKLRLDLGSHGDVRSFCQDYRGYLTKCRYNLEAGSSLSSIDGYIMGTERCPGRQSETSNLGVHHRFSIKGGAAEVREAVKRISSQGQLLVQSLGAFMRNEPQSHFGVKLSLSDVIETDINRFIPEKTAVAIKKFIYLVGGLLPGFAADGNAVYAPSFELGSRRVQLSSSFESSVPGIFVVGDATGHFRGAQQAMVSGVLAARKIKEAVKNEILCMY